MRKYLGHTVQKVFIMLGPRCNLRCRYCLQRPLMPEDKERQEIAPVVIDFLRDLSANQEQPLGIHFFGGEPTMYREEMAEIVTALRGGLPQSHRPEGTPDFTFSMISNGLRIDSDMAAWCNDIGMRVAISWDGPNTVATRSVNVFADPERRETLLSLKYLCITAVLSAFTYPLEILADYEALDREYHALHGYNIPLNFDPIMDTGLADRELLAVDLSRMAREAETIAAEYEKSLRGEEHNPWIANVAGSYVGCIRHIVTGAASFERSMSYCGTGLGVLNLDLAGNLYFCHNSYERIGTVESGFGAYMKALMRHECTRENSRVCKDCPVVAICNAGCPLIGPKERAETYCALRNALYRPFVDLVLRLGQEAPGTGGA